MSYFNESTFTLLQLNLIVLKITNKNRRASRGSVLALSVLYGWYCWQLVNLTAVVRFVCFYSYVFTCFK
jgi:hypothetical protein